MSRLANILVAAIGLGLAACRPAPPAGPPNLLLISLDTLRADHLGCYGYEHETTPFLDALAARGVLFRNAFANANGTDASHATMLTSHYVESHGVALSALAPPGEGGQRGRVKRIPEAIPLVQERLRDAGYATVGVTEGGLVSGAQGFGRGFDRFDDGVRNVHEGAARLLEMLRAQAEGARPIFAFFHTYQVHSPYRPPGPYRERFGRFESHARPDNDWLLPACREATGLDDEDFRYLASQYDGELRYTDDTLRQLFAELERIGFLENHLVIVTADHGEEFGEHGSCLHWSKLYDELLRVPLIVAGTGVPEGEVVERLVSSVDIVPTLLAAAGLEPGGSLAGRSLLAPPSAPAPGAVFAQEATYLYSVRTPDWKLIEQVHPPKPVELYDVRADPGETTNLAESRPAEVAALRRLLADWRSRAQEQRAAGKEAELDPDELERLRELGYVE